METTDTSRLPKPKFPGISHQGNTQGKGNTQRQNVDNRIAAVMAHTTRYSFKGAARLAADAGVSKSAISRLLNHQSNPSYTLMCRVTSAFEKRLGLRLDPRELVSLDGSYPTSSVCRLVGCKGCMPDEAFDGEGNLRPQFSLMKPGDWCKHPSLEAPHPQQEAA